MNEKSDIDNYIGCYYAMPITLQLLPNPNCKRLSDDDISVCYLYTDKISGTLSISNKAATCKSTVRGISGTTTKIVITQTLQKKMDLHGINTVVGQKHSTVGMRFIQIPKSL
ncbi:MAG: hypothetical protein ACLTD2_11120 [Ruminococcus sp.]